MMRLRRTTCTTSSSPAASYRSASSCQAAAGKLVRSGQSRFRAAAARAALGTSCWRWVRGALAAVGCSATAGQGRAGRAGFMEQGRRRPAGRGGGGQHGYMMQAVERGAECVSYPSHSPALPKPNRACCSSCTMPADSVPAAVAAAAAARGSAALPRSSMAMACRHAAQGWVRRRVEGVRCFVSAVGGPCTNGSAPRSTCSAAQTHCAATMAPPHRCTAAAAAPEPTPPPPPFQRPARLTCSVATRGPPVGAASNAAESAPRTACRASAFRSPPATASARAEARTVTTPDATPASASQT